MELDRDESAGREGLSGHAVAQEAGGRRRRGERGVVVGGGGGTVRVIMLF